MTHVARGTLAGIILCGGKSTRMGTDKAFVDFAGAPMVAWCAGALAQSASTLVVSGGTAPHADACARAIQGAWPRFTALRGIKVITAADAAPDAGPLAGLVAGLEAAALDRVVVSGCDTPLVPPAFYRRAVALLQDFAVVAVELERPEPLISAWRRAPALSAAKGALAERKGPSSLLGPGTRFVRAQELESWGLDPARFSSANTPEALGRLLELERGRAAPSR